MSKRTVEATARQGDGVSSRHAAAAVQSDQGHQSGGHREMDAASAETLHTLNDRQAASYIGKSRSWLKQARSAGSGEAPPYIRVGRSVRYLRRDLDVYLENHRVRPPGGVPVGPPPKGARPDRGRSIPDRHAQERASAATVGGRPAVAGGGHRGAPPLYLCAQPGADTHVRKSGDSKPGVGTIMHRNVLA
jgi:predicted DNA-binding transcriptional regulator AlpA